MRIAVNTRLLLKDNLDGIGWFTYETMKRIVAAHPEVEFFFLFDRKPHPDFLFADNVKPIVLWPQARHPILYILFFELAVPRALRKIKPDLFVSTDGYMSLRTKVKTLDVIHDLNFEHYPHHLPAVLSRYYRYFFPRFARKASRLATVSNFSKQDIAEQYGVSEDKIDVVYNGVNQSFEPIPDDRIKRIREKFSSGQPYFLFVGSIHPRKNLLNQLQAFFAFRERVDQEFKFLVVGSDFYGGSSIKKKIRDSKYEKDVIFVGRRNPSVLRDLYAASFALTYVSYFEGFGIPIVEAMRSGVPVITGNSSSMPEVGGSAVLTANPDSVDEISKAMERLHSDESLRERGIEEGIERAKRYTWDKSADNLWESILRTIDQSRA